MALPGFAMQSFGLLFTQMSIFENSNNQLINTMIARYKVNLKLLITCLACITFISAKAQEDITTYPVIIQFNSIGTGVPADAGLRSFISNFKRKNKIKKINAVRIGPMGKEGEYWLAFSLKKLSKKQAVLFCKQIKVFTKKKTDRGLMVLVENERIDVTTLGRATMQEVVF